MPLVSVMRADSPSPLIEAGASPNPKHSYRHYALHRQGVSTLTVSGECGGKYSCRFQSFGELTWGSGLSSHSPVSSLREGVEAVCAALSTTHRCGLNDVLVLAAEEDDDLLKLPCGLTMHCAAPCSAFFSSQPGSTDDGHRRGGHPTPDWVLSSLAVIHPDPKAQRAGATACVSINHQLVLSKTWHMKVALASCSIQESPAGLEALKAAQRGPEHAKKEDRRGTLARLRDLNKKQVEIHQDAAAKWSPEREVPRVTKTKRDMYVARPP